jgi:hypothetical protein
MKNAQVQWLNDLRVEALDASTAADAILPVNREPSKPEPK